MNKLFAVIIWVVTFIVVYFIVPTSGNVEYLRKNAKAYYASVGMEIVGEEGYNLTYGFGKFFSGENWYITRMKNDNSGTIYNSYIVRWGDEIHLYKLRAVNAITNKR